MIFVFHYDNSTGKIQSIKEFDSSEIDAVAKERLRLEISILGSKGRMEVVTLEADTLDALKKTHSRYWKSFEDMRMTNTAASSNRVHEGRED